MSEDTVRIPSVADTVRAYLLGGLFGVSGRWQNALIWLLVMAFSVLALPRWDSIENPPIVGLGVGLAIAAGLDAQRERQFGGPERLVVAAGLTTLVGLVAMFAVLYAVSVTFGPEPGSAPIDAFWRLPIEVQAGCFLGLAVLFVILYRVRRPARLREEAEFQERVRAERKARGRAVEA
jgi:hypothetical protein